ncbi:hypothetical protein B0H21DRAFT_724301 [Amylocystis lapponica]|nr:hypothetical protein B0H21DRAFT_724301 [Amylocystis lapponica]
MVRVPRHFHPSIFVVVDFILCGYAAFFRLTASSNDVFVLQFIRVVVFIPYILQIRERIDQYMIQSRYRYSVIRLCYRCDDNQRRYKHNGIVIQGV